MIGYGVDPSPRLAAASRPPIRKIRRFRPAFDGLEGRALMATVIDSTTPVQAGANSTTGLISLAAFHDPDYLASSNFVATISWGDGTSSNAVMQTGYLIQNEPGIGAVPQPVITDVLGRVLGAHTYHKSGTYPIDVTIESPNGQTTSATTTASVIGKPSPGFNVQDVGPLNATTDKTTGLIPLARFTEQGSQSPRKASAYHAQINWADGTRSQGVVRVLPAKTKGDKSPAVIEVLGAHTYSSQLISLGVGGDLGVVVTLTRPGVATSSTTIADVSFGNSPVTTPPTKHLKAGKNRPTGTIPIANFLDVETSPLPPESSYSAEITWGDGTRSPGIVKILSSSTIDFNSTYYENNPDFGFQGTIVNVQVLGHHVYRKSSTYGVDVTLTTPQRILSTGRSSGSSDRPPGV